MGKKKYSIIDFVGDNTNLKNNLSSIIAQKYNLDKIEIFIIDTTLNEETTQIINEYSKHIDINYFGCDESNIVDMYNKIIKAANGEIVTFISSDDYYKDKKVFHNLEKITRQHDLVSIASKYNDQDLNKFTNYKIQPRKKGTIDLLETPFLLSLNFNSYFISKKLINNLKFETNFIEDAKIIMLCRLLSIKNEYYFDNSDVIVSLKPFETNTSKCSIQYNKKWYIDSINNFIDFASKLENTPLFLQDILLYVIYAKINCNIYDRNKNILDKSEVEVFFNKVAQLAKYIDNSIILNYEDDTNKYLFSIPRWVRYYIVQQKYNQKPKINVSDDKIILKYGDDVIQNDDTSMETVNVHAINYKDGKLYFDCTTSLKDILDSNNFIIYAKFNDEKIEVKQSYFYPLLKVFGKTLSEKYCFNFSVDVKDKTGDLKLYAVIDNEEIPLKFKYVKVHARLSKSKRSFWHYKNFVLHNNIDSITIKKANRLNLIKSEFLFDFSKLKNEKNKIRVIKLILLRYLYYITKPFYKNKHIWLTWDKLYKAGDNGEYMYQYCLKQGRNIYYIIKKDSPDYKRLKKQNKKRCVVFNSLKAKLLSLHSEAILDTHANVISYCGFDGISRHFVCGIFNPEIICIQHGLTIQKIAQYQNRLFDNIKYYCCASPFEIENIKNPLYDYTDEQMGLTGLARYDGLKSKEEKIILITPTWRRNVVNSSVAYIKKKHNANFKNSDYFTIYNSLINNKKLIDCAKKYSYKIIYLLHPAMSGQLEDFDKNDFVDIIPATGDINYEDILTRAALMVTDYSGVQFDFAYQRKVLVYYHPDALPPHYDAGGLEYETMGFGPVCKNEEQIVNELCDNMKKGCKIKNIYKKRADSFFAYDDFNNCERILKEIDKYFENI